MELIILDETESTNTLALKMASKQNAPHGTAILAFKQTNGHGQFSRPWNSPIGGMYLSVIFRGSIPETVTIGEIIRDFLTELTGSNEFTIKLPNDILFKDRKICGILIESVSRGQENYGAIGIGINVNNEYPLGANLKEIIGEQDVASIAKEIARRVSK
jgi:BirA family biotin operon repressor/biotin-[acetyl-CoA-carboxylase] ligase